MKSKKNDDFLENIAVLIPKKKKNIMRAGSQWFRYKKDEVHFS